MTMSKPLEMVAVVGTGTLGAQIALLAASAGYGVRAFDAREGAFHETLERIRSDLRARGIQPFIPWELWEGYMARVQVMPDMEGAVADAELVVEAVPERLELKRRVFRELGRLAPAGAVLATNSSAIPVSRLEGSSGRPERCLNLHFYMPLQGTNMVDVMGGSRTLPEVLEAGAAWVRSLGCIPLTVRRESVGFCFNRVWRAVKREVLHMWADGYVDFRDVDRAWMVFTGMDMGPFGLMDMVGLDVVHDIEMVYHRESGDPRDRPPQALEEKVERGELGEKAGRGFYTYPDPEYRRPAFLDPSTA
ncbi:hypothetical protein AC482_01610 [miscellaneous Crenarchaeota group-15 archaeon DG-45]|uniref:3-hydroxyacyl-CoA dehydrogenase n=1 Tax=miscellaneous Crenarchaeota group-15 archaeon DG-45 TaxID=1685127 RepID=A0A0M0BRE8_9ARCH|nr:MAG: hypothetical protein AC482_01610 [miscellaneous Crenarchaeota group-15 archaeon DG-45]